MVISTSWTRGALFRKMLGTFLFFVMSTTVFLSCLLCRRFSAVSLSAWFLLTTWLVLSRLQWRPPRARSSAMPTVSSGRVNVHSDCSQLFRLQWSPTRARSSASPAVYPVPGACSVCMLTTLSRLQWRPVKARPCAIPTAS